MSRNTTPNTTAGILGVALAGLVFSSSAFAVQPLTQGYMLAASHATAEGKCGEGKCGADESTAAKAKGSAAKKTVEGKCGEGQCGDARFAAADTDDDAKVSRAEFLSIVPNGGSAFAKKDVNSDGYISEKESYDSVKAAYNANGKELPSGLFHDVKE
jgi:uncharacterized low-complexity protein